MQFKRLLKRLAALSLMVVLLTGSVSICSFADEIEGEETEGEEMPEGEELPEGEEGEGELSPEEALAALETVVPSSIPTNIDGKYLALSFPASQVPKGFAVKTVDYQGEQVSLCHMTAKSAVIGAEGLTIYLAYLTDENGQNGEFYICDTTENARMSDMIKIDGPDEKYIIVLDPGDNVVGPSGFTQHKLQWGNKTAVAWSLPEETVEEEEEKDKDKDKDKDKEEPEKDASLFSVVAYADELNLTAGEAAAKSVIQNTDTAEPEEAAEPGEAVDMGGAEDSAMDDENAMLALDSIAHTNAAGLIQAQPKEFCLLYAIDESANLGFYLYDIDRGTYQRYVDIPKGESATLTKYRKLSRTRLFIIIILAIILVIMAFVLINLILNGRNSSYEEGEDDEEEAMRKRAKDKERKSIGRRDGSYSDGEDEEDEEFEDDYEEDAEEEEDYEAEEEEEDEVEEERPIRRRSVTKGRQEPQRRAAAELSAETSGMDVDWEHMEITAGLNPKKTKEAMNKKSAPKYDLDEDFDFEFLNIKK